MAKVEGIFISGVASEPMISLETANAVAGKGLEGDRYYLGQGFYSDGKDGRHLTLIEKESLDALLQDFGVVLEPNESRRNVVTSGVRLNDLVGKRFRVGAIECEGIRLCTPCKHLEELTRPGMLRGLTHSGGLRANILNDGTLSVGDEIQID